ncbi:extracellular solute-binding protein [Butyrivibrio sp. CB08]|uniref:sugar ABC transporter substrate-binding protein n=1 Tax=Butyrivibrio sp. CB08 TaxID=2364879 RepID=UPI000EA96D92|nr:extracellular solute-binding protein [Butyrivibrio sp. CB08]RKM62534.1 extracellular solute-binding protein [Butyrivibrio sp. CB08]
MRLRVRIISIILVACALAGTYVYARSDRSIFEDYSFFSRNKTTVRLWYTDDSLTPYLQSKAVAYSESNSKVRVEPVLVSGLEYLEAVNKASVEEDNYPDLYIITNDSLEKAYLAGLAKEITDDGFLTKGDFPAAALNSVTYKDKLVAYPFYFETSTLLYNRTYLENMATENLQSEIDIQEGEAAQAEIDAGQVPVEEAEASEDIDEAEDEDEYYYEDDEEEAEDTSSVITQLMIDEAVAESLPLNISDILKFAEVYNAPEQVEAVFRWDVTDIFYNYFFVGNYMSVGGDAGDDLDQFDIYNTDTISCMKIYQQLNQFFAIDPEQIDYDKIVQDFIDGKIVFTIATTDIMKKIEEAKASGQCEYEFEVADMPGLTGDFGSRTMSVTECLVVNGYSENSLEAEDVARYFCSDNSGDIYKLSGKLAAHEGVNYEDTKLNTFVSVYADSVPMPKTIETSNLWMELEIAFTNIWNGADCNSTLKAVSESIMTQITGTPYTETTIPDPDDKAITAGLVEDND